MTIRAERITLAVEAALRADFGDAVTRGREWPVSEDILESIDIRELADEVSRASNDAQERALEIELRIVTRDGSARSRLAMLRARINWRLYTDADLAAVRQAIVDGGTEWAVTGHDDVGVMMMRYRMLYRCATDTLE